MKLLLFSSLLILCCAAFVTTDWPGGGDKQGIKGYVLQDTGNQMPSPDEPASRPKGVKTTVYVYQKTNLSQVTRNGTEPFYNAIKTKLVKTVQTTSKGYFFVPLPAGTYSLFTKVNGRLYANSFDVDNNIAPVVVTKGRVSESNLTISAGVSY
jgi:hypothetical protein